jgi:two-component system, chemotaxis family, chemotaxis protein CheY
MAHVLVVEDDADISMFIAEVLRGRGYDVETAENGAVGMEKVRHRPPDVITLDLMMPVMDGWEFLRQCRMLPDCACSPILVLSAARMPNPELFGNCEFLAKPFELNDLLHTVERLAARPPLDRTS